MSNACRMVSWPAHASHCLVRAVSEVVQRLCQPGLLRL